MDQPFGHTIQLQLRRRRPWLSLGPGWAALAGALASGGFDLEVGQLVSLVLLWLLVDPLLGTVWHLAFQAGPWRDPDPAALPEATSIHLGLVPYATPGALGFRLARWWGRLRAWDRLGHENGPHQAFVTFVGGTILALILGVLLKPIFGLLILLSLGLAALAGRGEPWTNSHGQPFWQAIGNVTIPWLMGMFLFDSFTLFATLLAVCYTLVYWGGLRLSGGQLLGERTLIAGQAAAALLLIGLRAPLNAAVLVLMILIQLVLRTQAGPSGGQAWYLRGIQPGLVIGLLAAAWGAA
jgi:hypothetical protein